MNIEKENKDEAQGSNMIGQEGFFGLGIAPEILTALEKLHFKNPTPIQAKVIPIALEAKDVMGIAQTGTGKTLAFGVPLTQRSLSTGTKSLVLVPTRELAIQVYELINKFSRLLKISVVLVIGGRSMYEQKRDLSKRPDIVIATPGRLNDLLQSRSYSLNNTHTIVLDEADRMLDMGFEPQIQSIFEMLPQDHHTMLFSATMPQEISKLATSYMQLPVRVEVAKVGSTVSQINQEVIFLRRNEKLTTLLQLLDEFKGSVLIFCRTKYNVKNLAFDLRQKFTVAEIHSQRTLAQRINALEGFKSGKYRVLIATDIAARGIHVNNIELVINYELPDNPDDYVHRVGRTGRAGKAGAAISFVTPEQRSDIKRIERLIQKTLPVKKVHLSQEQLDKVALELSQAREEQGGDFERPQRGFGGRGGIRGGDRGGRGGDRGSRGSFGGDRGRGRFAGNRDRDAGPRRPAFSESVGRSAFSAKPRSIEAEAVGAAPVREGRSFGDRPPRPGRNFGDRPSRPFGDRPARSFGDRPARNYSDRTPGSFRDRPTRSSSDRPARSFGDRPSRPFGDRPARSFGDRPRKPFGSRPFRSEGSTGEFRNNDKPRGSFGARKPGGFGRKRTGGFGGKRKQY